MWIRQKAAKKEPLQLVKQVDTRWNSVYDSHCKMVCLCLNDETLCNVCFTQVRLRLSINAVVALPSSDWDAMEQSVKIMKPFAMATDICQRDEASVATVLREFQKLPAHFQALPDQYPDLEHFFDSAQVVPSPSVPI